MPVMLRQPKQREPHGEVLYVTSPTLDRLLRDWSMPILMSVQTPKAEARVDSLEMGANAFAGALRVCCVNVLTNRDLAARFHIRIVPTRLFFKTGIAVEFIDGPVPTRFMLHVTCKVIGVKQKGEVQDMREHHVPHELDLASGRTRSKRRACLRCNRTFWSEGPHHRLCRTCRATLATMPTPAEEYRLWLP